MWFVEDYCFAGEHSRQVYTVQDLDIHSLMSWFDNVPEVLTTVSRIVLNMF